MSKIRAEAWHIVIYYNVLTRVKLSSQSMYLIRLIPTRLHRVVALVFRFHDKTTIVLAFFLISIDSLHVLFCISIDDLHDMFSSKILFTASFANQVKGKKLLPLASICHNDIMWLSEAEFRLTKGSVQTRYDHILRICVVYVFPFILLFQLVALKWYNLEHNILRKCGYNVHRWCV